VQLFIGFQVLLKQNCLHLSLLPYLTEPLGWAGFYTCPALRPYQFGPTCKSSSVMQQYFCFSSHGYYWVHHFVFV